MDFWLLFLLFSVFNVGLWVVLFIWAVKREQAGAEKWRHGQKPIGKLISAESDEEGIRITGSIADPELAKLIQGDVTGYSIPPYHFDAPPTSEVKTSVIAIKKTHFDIDRDTMFNMSIEDWDLFTKKLGQVWLNMLRDEGYEVVGGLTSRLVEQGGLLFGTKRVEYEVETRRDES